jgi:flagellum-specific peptidoglycan hydrolase FlgJ
MHFNTRQEYIAYLGPIAVACRVAGSPIFPSVRIAETIQEQGGYSIPDSFNLVGYKVGKGIVTEYWDGSTVTDGTWEEEAGKHVDQSAVFRKYTSLYNCFRDQDLLFYRLDRYVPLLRARTALEQVDALGKSGYATDSKYGEAIKGIIRSYNLTQYDIKAEEEGKMIQEQINQLNAKVAAQAKEIQQLKQLDAVPAWAEEAVAKFSQGVDPALVDKTGSYDFFRIITVLNRVFKTYVPGFKQ